jgi:hypothetical protein
MSALQRNKDVLRGCYREVVLLVAWSVVTTDPRDTKMRIRKRLASIAIRDIQDA